MIQIKKLKSLRSRVAIRKIADIFHQNKTEGYDKSYIDEVFSVLLENNEIPFCDKEKLKALYKVESSSRDDDIYYFLLNTLGESPADWDFVNESGMLDRGKRLIKEHYLYLDHIRSPYNLGSIFRSSESLGVKKIILSRYSPDPHHPRAEKTSMGTVDAVDYIEGDLEYIKSLNMPVFALETGGKELKKFSFPENGIAIIGSEETGVSPEALSLAMSSWGICSIKQYGAKGSLNVASATAILLNAWMENEE